MNTVSEQQVGDWQYLHRLGSMGVPGALKHTDGRILGLDWEGASTGLLVYLNALEAEVRELREKLAAVSDMKPQKCSVCSVLLEGARELAEGHGNICSTCLISAVRTDVWRAVAALKERIDLLERRLAASSNEGAIKKSGGIAFVGLSELQLTELKRLGGPLHVHRGMPQ